MLILADFTISQQNKEKVILKTVPGPIPDTLQHS